MRDPLAKQRRVRDGGLEKVSSATRWIAGGALVAAGAFSAAFGLPQLLTHAQADTNPATAGPDVPTPTGGRGITPSAPSTGGALSVPTQPPVQSRHRSRVVTGAS